MFIHLFASQLHYSWHLESIGYELDRQGLLASRSLSNYGLPPGLEVDVRWSPGTRGLVLVASYQDALRAPANCGVVLMEHGAGQTYNGRGHNYADYPKERIFAYFAPGPHAAEQFYANNRGTPTYMVGWPGLENAQGLRSRGVADNINHAVICSFHWKSFQESWAIWGHAITELAEQLHNPVLLHGHPRCAAELVRLNSRTHVPFCHAYENVIQMAAVYVVDNSSTAFEMLALGVPVILLNQPGWSELKYGLRFSPMIHQLLRPLEHPRELRTRVQEALDNPQTVLRHADTILNTVYRPREDGTKKAVELLRQLYQDWTRQHTPGNTGRA